MKKLNKKKGILFWITGLSGSGKTSIAKRIKNHIIKKHGPTIILSGDDIRKIFKLNRYAKKNRLTYALNYSNFCQKITNQKMNVIFSTVSLFHKVRKWNKSNINNYVEIYIKSDIKRIVKLKKKYFYRKKIPNVLGQDIKAEFPEKPNIIINNNFKKSILKLSQELIKKIDREI